MTTPRKNILLCATLTIFLAALLIQGAAFAGQLDFSRHDGSSSQDKAVDKSRSAPSQIDEAQQATAQALAHVTAALLANCSERAHAVKAKALLEQASNELKLANPITYANPKPNISASTTTGK